VEERGVVVDDDLNEYLSHITKEHSSEILQRNTLVKFWSDTQKGHLLEYFGILRVKCFL